MAIGMGILLLSYTLVLLIMTGVVIKNRKETVYAEMAGNDIPSVLNIVRSMIVGSKRDLFRSANRGWSFSVV